MCSIYQLVIIDVWRNQQLYIVWYISACYFRGLKKSAALYCVLYINLLWSMFEEISKSIYIVKYISACYYLGLKKSATLYCEVYISLLLSRFEEISSSILCSLNQLIIIYVWRNQQLYIVWYISDCYFRCLKKSAALWNLLCFNKLLMWISWCYNINHFSKRVSYCIIVWH